MSATYPELYAATGIHSGLPYGSATDLASAFAAMRGASSTAQPASMPAPRQHRIRGNGANGRVRTIVFHGASDNKVDPSNGETILADARAGLSRHAHESRHDGFAGGRAYRRVVISDASGVIHAEHWSVEGLGHAWSGGSPEGSYTDHRGPDASREMLRFFFETSMQSTTR
jgi:poly(3-hydroxybutyrate) depolymerase